MKTIFPLACAALCTFVSSALSFDELAVYKAENIDDSGGKMIWNDPVGGDNLENKDPVGITIGDKPEVGNDAKSVVFSGEQTSPFRTVKPVKAAVGALKVTLAYKPGTNPASAEQTLIRQGNWELRYYSEKEELSFIVWHDAKNYSWLPVKIEPGTWHQVTATFADATLTLEVSGRIQTRTAKGPLGAHNPESAIFIGASTGATKGGVPSRPLSGALADIHISGE